MDQHPFMMAALIVMALGSPSLAHDTPHIGSLDVHACGQLNALCGRIDRPLDPTGAVTGVVSVYFEFYPHTAPGTPSGTLVATEGVTARCARICRSPRPAVCTGICASTGPKAWKPPPQALRARSEKRKSLQRVRRRRGFK